MCSFINININIKIFSCKYMPSLCGLHSVMLPYCSLKKAHCLKQKTCYHLKQGCWNPVLQGCKWEPNEHLVSQENLMVWQSNNDAWCEVVYQNLIYFLRQRWTEKESVNLEKALHPGRTLYHKPSGWKTHPHVPATKCASLSKSHHNHLCLTRRP